jgi:hypothetical protein
MEYYYIQSSPWDSHELAFTQLSHPNQVMVRKLQHNLVNTNSQNAEYYGKSPCCPCCLSTKETLAHSFSCPSEGSTEHRLKAISTLQEDLASIKMSPTITFAITHGITIWVHYQTEEDLRVHAPTVGSFRGPDIL